MTPGGERRLVALDPATVPIDNDYYSDVGDSWWDARGPLRALHDMNPARVAYFDAVAARLGPRGSLRVLDVGCGGGLVAEPLAALGYRVTGVDLSSGAIETARDHARASGVAVTYRVGSAYALPVGDAAVDVVVVSDVLEHLHDLTAAVAEMSRVLRPGGVVAFDTINRTAAAYLVAILAAERILGIVHPGTHNWRMFVRPGELAALFARHGLRPAELRGLAPAAPVHRLVAAALRGRPLGGFHLTRSAAVSYIGHAVKTQER
ncbi:bifunctional 2-polyprenyl-6-hydroxyphenol methylase/3-demethylubiquinol 3-O-methyltransferase UbiG [Microtetraspora fusca]|uniref:bifunctional 2-polyprenyl-6-hydroxyphenol methylase/3-demethylubiquinol 3-O-methyltransferase UbiG n=1 Tax=Microtetraspora fusca TaxID=1997 RepID=UPI000AF23944|nr:bifunctional 2-polyprenyl-6-hydroxyphenol methylase/3-demethylubiquinol 3-O-methyltransferase UbiG [Microtetraspora fusca]